MALTERIVAEVLRQRLGLPDGSQAARFLNAIPEVLKATARKVAADPNLRPLMLTDPTTVSVTLTAGSADLASTYSTHRILLEYIDKGYIYHSSFQAPLKRIPLQSANFEQQFDEYGYYWIAGDDIHAQQADKTALTGSLTFEVPTYPANVAGLPSSDEIEKLFLDKMFEWAVSNQMPGNDAAEDAEG